MMCAEADPIQCHRFLLIARSLTAMGLNVNHIHSDGRIEGHGEAEARMLRAAGLAQAELFGPETDALALAYAAQATRFGYAKQD